MDDDALSRLGRALRSRDQAAFAACLTSDADLLIPHSGGELAFMGRDAITGACGALLSASPDLTYSVERRYVTPREVIEEASVEGTHVGVFAGVPGSGERIRLGMRVSARLDGDGLIRHVTAWPDLPALWAQLGVRDSAAAAANAVVASVRDQSAGGVQVIRGVAPKGAAVPARPPAATPRPGGQRRGPSWWNRHRRGVLGLAGLAAAAAITAWVVFAVVLSAPTQTVSAVHPTLTTSPSPSRPPVPSTSAHLPEIVAPIPSASPTEQPGEQISVSTDVLFSPASAKLTVAAHARLAVVASQVRRQHVQGLIQVNGYTDSQGSASMNQALSEQRATAVAEELRALLNGVPVALMPQGFGETHPVATNATPQGRAKNRRVTVVLPKP